MITYLNIISIILNQFVMTKSIDELVQENIELKKAVALSKIAIERTQYQYAFLKESYQEVTSRYQSVQRDFAALSNNHRNLQRKNLDDSRYLEERISELKDIVEEKQREIEQIQIKILPNLDEDTIKIRVIREIQGPYQQMIEKKDQELEGLKKTLYEREKRMALMKMQMDDEKLGYEREVDELKQYHLGQIKTVNGSLEQIVSWNESKEKDKQTIKLLRRNIEEARKEVELVRNELEDLRRESDGVRGERNDLLIKMTSVESVKNGNVTRMEMEKIQMQDRVRSKEVEVEGMVADIAKIKAEVRTLKEKNVNLEEENERVSTQLRDTKQQLTSTVRQLQRSRHHIQQLQLRIHSKQEINRELQKQQSARTSELSEMEKRIRETRENVETKEYNYRKEMEEFGNVVTERLEERVRELEEENRRIKAEARREGYNEIEGRYRESAEEMRREIDRLEGENAEVNRKLRQASATIVKLLKEKMNEKRGENRNENRNENRQENQDHVVEGGDTQKGFSRRNRARQEELDRERERRESPHRLLSEIDSMRPSLEYLDAALVPLVPMPHLYPPAPLLYPTLPRDLYIPTKF